MAETTNFQILALPKLPGASGLPVINSQRYALRDRAGNLIGYGESTTLQNWSSLGLALNFVTLDGVDMSKQVQFNLFYNAQGQLAGGSMLSNGKTYDVTAAGTVIHMDKLAPISFPDYGAFKGSDFLGAGAEGADKGAAAAGKVIIADASGFIAKQLDKTAIANAALAVDTRGVVIEAAGIVGTGVGVVLGATLGSAVSGGTPGWMAVGAGVGAYFGNEQTKLAAQNILSPEYSGYVYYDGSPYRIGTSDPVTQAAGWYRIQPDPSKGIYRFDSLADSVTAQSLTDRMTLVNEMAGLVGWNNVGVLPRMDGDQMRSFVLQNPGFGGNGLIMNYLNKLGMGAASAPSLVNNADLYLSVNSYGAGLLYTYANGVYRSVNSVTHQDVWMVPNAATGKLAIYTADTQTGATTYNETDLNAATAQTIQSGGIPRPSSSAFVTASAPHTVVVNSSPDGKNVATVSDIVAIENARRNYITKEDVRASNQWMGEKYIIHPGDTIYVPEKHSDGSTTYYYAGGAVITSNPVTGEYNMVVPNADGGMTTYSRSTDADAGYTVRQRSTNGRDNNNFDFTGHQASLTSEIKPISIDWQNPQETGKAVFSPDGSHTETITTPDGIETGSLYNSNGVLTGRSKTLDNANSSSTSDTLANTLQSLRNAAGDLDEAVLDAAELRTLTGSQAEGETWGGARLLTLGDSTLGDYYRHHQDIQTGATIPLLLDDPQTQGLGLLDGFDLGNGASVLDGSFESWNYLNNSAGGANYIDWGYDSSVVDYVSYTYDSNAYSYSSYTYDSYDYSAYNYGGYDYGWGSWWPVALDLDADGIELVTQADSHAWYDVQGDGYRRNIGWVGSDDALLAIDDNHDGKVSEARELSFAMWTADTHDTDLEALNTLFDSNHDQKLDAQDARFSDLRSWQDKNGDGVSDVGELKTLAEAGIKSISLNVAKTDWNSGGNHVAGFASYEKTDGTRGWAADVGLGYDTQGWKASLESNLVRMTESGGLVYGIARSNALNLDLGAQGLDGAIGGASSDTLVAGNKNAVLLEGGAGDDKLIGGAGDDWLAGDAGSDTLSGSDGDDTLLIDAQDVQANLNGGAGFDMAVITSTAAVSLDLGAASVEAAVGGAGNDDLRTSGTGRVILAGGAGADSLTGGAAGDLLYGGTGTDTLKGGRGNDVYVFNRGDGADTVTDAATGMTTVTNTTASVEYYPTVVLEPWVLAIDYPFQDLLDRMLAQLNATGVPYGSFAYSYPLSFAFKNGWRYATGSRTTYTTTTTPVEVEVDAGQDTLRFGVGIGREDLMLTASGADGVFSITHNGVVTSDQITLKNQTNAKARIESVEFSDGQKYAIEDLMFGGTGADTLVGTAAANLINGGAGTDTMRGGAGSDIYVVDNAGDNALENTSEGTDTVLSSVSYTLGANIENLTLTGTGTINGTGNTLNNVITGNSAANTLDGGAGDDTLNGGAGDDRYRFNLGGGQDTVTDASGSDRIVFGPGINATQITASMANGQVKLTVGTADSVSFSAPAFNNYAIEQFEFADGSIKDAAWLNGLLNTTPTGSNKTLSLNEDGSYAITASDLGFSDATPGDSLGAVRIDTLPGAGSLKLNGTAVTSAQVISAVDLMAGRLVFAPTANANGSSYAALNFSVKDQYGAFDAAPNTLTFNVTPVNDAPALTGTKAILSAGTEDTAYTITKASLLAGFSDVEGGALSVINLSAGNGTLSAFNAATSWTFTPNANYNGAVNLSYGVSDGTAVTPATQNFTLTAVNDAPMGSTTISGTPIQKQTLTAANTLVDVDGLGIVSYQWLASGAAIAGATGSSLVIGQAQVGKTISVKASYTDLKGTAESVTSANTAVVANVNDAPTGSVTMLRAGVPLTASTNVLQGEVLSAANTLADADGLGAVSYQWLANGSVIAGATISTLTLNPAYAGQTISVKASYTDSYGMPESMTSAATAAVNRMVGTSGADTLAGSAGSDQLEGLTGDDRYTVNSTGDVVIENIGEGTDTVQSSIGDLTLAANVENLTLLGSANSIGVGNGLNNAITGNGGHNVLNGGFGNDTLTGGAGDDLLDGATGDVVKVIQTVPSAASYLTRYLNQSSGSGQVIGEVNSTGDSIIRAGRLGESFQLMGSSAVDKTYVGAGTTVDALLLGGGIDEIYVTGRLQDYGLGVVGTTLVLSRTTGLAAGQSELIKVAASTGSANDKLVFADGAISTLSLKATIVAGTAPVLDTTQRSNPADAGFAVLSQGADTMIGGAGNDSYTADDIGDVILENAAEGTDLVQSYIASYTLSANVENLSLAGAAAISGVGNGLDNLISGNGGNNALNGAFGNDTLTGGAGDDVLDGATGDVVKVFQASTGTGYLARYFNLSAGSSQAIGEVISTGESIIRAGHLGENLQVLGSSMVDKMYVGAGTTVDATSLGGGADEIYVTGRLQDYSLSSAGSIVSLTRTSGLPPGQGEMVKVAAGAGVANDKLVFLDGAVSTLSLKTAIAGGMAPVLDTLQRSNPADGGFVALSQGADTLTGGTGNDTFAVDDAGDLVQENAGEGTDTVQSYLANYTLGANVENLALLGSLNANGTGNALNNVLSGNVGNNILAGGAGSDSYLAYRGMGQDRIVENDSTPGNTDVLSFGTGIANNQLWFRHTGNDLEVSIIGTADKVTVQNWYLGDPYHVEQIKSGDGKALQHIDVDKLVSAMAAFSPPGMGQTSLTAAQQTALAPMLAANWH